MNKKTDYPDLERSENVSFWKHLLNWLWNKPRRIAEEFYEKYFLSTNKELLKKELELEMLRYKIKELELQININQVIQEADNITKFPTGTTIR